jgi:putative endonuclease
MSAMEPGLRRDDKGYVLRLSVRSHHLAYFIVIPWQPFVPGFAGMTRAMLYVYLLASKPCGTLYVGVTSDLPKRIFEHKSKAVSGFTTYRVDKLAWFEAHEAAEAAIRHEKQIKEWRWNWKISLIERDNPHWIDLYQSL